MDGQPCHGCLERDRIIDALQRRVADLEKRLDALERTGKRQAAPFSKGDTQAQPKKTGRKAGEKYGQHAKPALSLLPESGTSGSGTALCPITYATQAGMAAKADRKDAEFLK
jgi:hypothetical protein